MNAQSCVTRGRHTLASATQRMQQRYVAAKLASTELGRIAKLCPLIIGHQCIGTRKFLNHATRNEI
eukprot:4777822-Amphidinium_carterae.1